MPRTGYCAATDLLVGNIPLPAYLTAEQVVADAADEIDSHLGFIYIIPIQTTGMNTTVTPNVAVSPVVALLMKRLNATLASGRLILQIDAGGEDKTLHAYGVSLIKDAMDALNSMEEGQMILPGVPLLDPDPTEHMGPLISNLDSESSVEAFYNRIANPYYQYWPYVGSIPSGDSSFPVGFVAEKPTEPVIG